MSHGADSLKSIFYALGANLAIAVSKFVAAIITSSGSMLAESVHSLADCGNQILLLVGIRNSKKPPTPDHPLGFGKSIYFWSFIVAIMLFSMGGLFSVYEGIHKLHTPEPMAYPLVAIGVLLFAMIAEGLSLAGCIREVNKERHGQNLIQWFHNTRKSELLVVFGEDLAALIGLSFALAAICLTMITGNPMWDAMGSIAIGVLLIVVAVFVGIEIEALIIGQGVEENLKARMIEYLEQIEPVHKVLNLLTLQLGNDVMVAVKAKMHPQASNLDLITAINRCEVLFKKEFPQVLWLFFEPDIAV